MTWIENKNTFSDIIRFFSIIIFCQGIRFVLASIYNYYELQTDVSINQYIYKKIIQKAESVPLQFFEDPKYYDDFYKTIHIH